MDIPGMDRQTALTLQLTEDFLRPLMPPATLKFLKPYIDRAGKVLDQPKGSKLGAWPKKVHVLSRGQALLPPEISLEVFDAVSTALMEERRFQVHYRPREGEGEKNYEVNPLGLVCRDGVIYLVCTLWNYDDIKQLALHRMSQVLPLNKPASVPKEFTLDGYIRQGEFSYPVSGESIGLRVLFEAGAAHHLYETRLVEDQRLSPQPDGRVLLEATVLDTAQLRWWLLGFGDQVEVLEPAGLRKEFEEISHSMAQLYQA